MTITVKQSKRHHIVRNRFFHLSLWGFLLLSTFVMAVSVNTFDLPLRSSGKLVFYVDLCQFEGQDGQTVVEVIYSLDMSQLTSPELTADTANFTIHLQLLNTDMQTLLDISEDKSASVHRREGETEGFSFIDLKRFAIVPDTVLLNFTISARNPDQKGFVNTAFVARKFSDQFSLSDVFFVSHVQSAGGESVFTRHGAVMVPNPHRVFVPSQEQPDMFVYFEINNLSYSADEPSLYSLNYSLEDLTGNAVVTKNQPTLPVSGANTSRIEKISLKEIPPGTYRFKLQVIDLKSGENLNQRKYVRVFTGVEGSDLLLPMSKEDIKKYYDQIKYIATNDEKKIFRELSPKGKQEFLLQFWKSRDPDPATPENEFMEEHFRRIAYCEEHFKNGINSDMGRVYIEYGPPLDIRRMFSTVAYNKPVVIWVYALEGQSEFVFVDRIGGDQYVLVHSSHPDEFSNPNWEDDLK